MPSAPPKHAEYMRRRYQEDDQFRERHKNRVAVRKAKIDAEGKQIIEEAKAGGCRLCDETASCCLSFHHVGEKRFPISNWLRTVGSIAKLVAELDQCICVCENCHRKMHAGLL